jgi:hypothetical protein
MPVDAGLIAIGLAGFIALERIAQILFGRVRESDCMSVHVRNDPSPEEIEIGPTLGLGQRRVANQSI